MNLHSGIPPMITGHTLGMIAVKFAILTRALQTSRAEVLSVVVLRSVSFTDHHTGFTTFVYTLPSVIFTDTNLAAVRLYATLLLIRAVPGQLPCDSRQGYDLIDKCQSSTCVRTTPRVSV